MKRREFIKLSTLAATAAVVPGAAFGQAGERISMRPAITKRKFTSLAVEAKIAEVKAKLKDPELAWLFENCYPNTLDTTVFTGTRDGKPDTFVITGDIDALWLRDSTAQVTPYLPLAKPDEILRLMIRGRIPRNAYSILLDPYPNAFMHDPNAIGWESERPKSKRGI